MKKLNLRIPDDLHAALTEIAKSENRSLNAQMITALQYFADMIKRRDKADRVFAEMRAGNYVELGNDSDPQRKLTLEEDLKFDEMKKRAEDAAKTD